MTRTQPAGEALSQLRLFAVHIGPCCHCHTWPTGPSGVGSKALPLRGTGMDGDCRIAGDQDHSARRRAEAICTRLQTHLLPPAGCSDELAASPADWPDWRSHVKRNFATGLE
jgi:hypothetical protein